MERRCVVLRVKNELIPNYLVAHRNVPLELCEAMRETGIQNYSLFLADGGLLIEYLESEDIKESLRLLGDTEVSREWETRMSPFFESESGDTGADGLICPQQIFHI